jgi:hypothetical protein
MAIVSESRKNHSYFKIIILAMNLVFYGLRFHDADSYRIDPEPALFKI